MSESERDEAAEAPARKAPRPVRFRHLVAAMAATAVLAGGITAYAADSFSDVPESNPFHDEIGWMSDTGISEGYEDGTYRPTAPVSRQAMSAFMQRLYNVQAGTTNVTTVADSAASAASPNADPFDSGWVNANDLVTDVVVPPGTQARLVATLSGETICNGGIHQFALLFDVAPRCMVRLQYVRIGGLPGIAQAMSPNEFDVAYSDLTQAQLDDSGLLDNRFQNDSFSVMAASPGVVGAGTWRVTPQIMVNNGGGARTLTMDLNASTLKVEAILQDAAG